MTKKLFKSLAMASATLAISSFALNSYAKTTLTVWSFSNELKVNGTIDAYEKQYPNVHVKLTVFPIANYLTKLKPTLRSRRNAPDLFLADINIIKELTRTKYWMKLDKEVNAPAIKDDYVPYAWNLGKDKSGNLRAMTWQSTPGGFFYRRSYAKKFLGTDDPKTVAKAISNWDKFFATAKMIDTKSKGSVKMIAGAPSDLFYPLKANRKHGYIVDGKFVIPDSLLQWMDIYKRMYTENLCAKTGNSHPSWFNGIKKGVFGYFLPKWAVKYNLKPTAPETSGDWAVTNPTVSYFHGGSWMGVYYKTPHKKEALDFLKLQAVSKEHMAKWVADTGDFVSRISVLEASKNIPSEFLGGQKSYQVYLEEAKKIKVTGVSRYDDAIDRFFQDEGLRYANGHQTKAETIKNIKDKVLNAYQLESK